MINDLLILLGIFIVTIIVLWGVAKDGIKNDNALYSWAEMNGYKIIKRRYAYPWESIFYNRSHVQPVYILEIQDTQGNNRKCSVKLGTPFKGVSGDLKNLKAQVTWFT